MMRRLFLIGGAVTLLLGLVFGRSHIATTVGMVKQQVKDNVPIDFEIKRATAEPYFQNLSPMNDFFGVNHRRVARVDAQAAGTVQPIFQPGANEAETGAGRRQFVAPKQQTERRGNLGPNLGATDLRTIDNSGHIQRSK